MGTKEEIRVKWRHFVRAQYQDYRGDAIGNERTVSKYAALIGISQQLLSDWMKLEDNKTPEHKKTIEKAVAFWGPVVYDILELPRPNPTVEALRPLLEQARLDEEATRELREMVRRFLENHGDEIHSVD